MNIVNPQYWQFHRVACVCDSYVMCKNHIKWLFKIERILMPNASAMRNERTMCVQMNREGKRAARSVVKGHVRR